MTQTCNFFLYCQSSCGDDPTDGCNQHFQLSAELPKACAPVQQALFQLLRRLRNAWHLMSMLARCDIITLSRSFELASEASCQNYLHWSRLLRRLVHTCCNKGICGLLAVCSASILCCCWVARSRTVQVFLCSVVQRICSTLSFY
jgi:hypothetical protein